MRRRPECGRSCSPQVCGWCSGDCSFTHGRDRKSTRLNSSHTEIYTLSLHDALPILSRSPHLNAAPPRMRTLVFSASLRLVLGRLLIYSWARSEERRVGKECRSRCDWSSDVCSSDLVKIAASECGAAQNADARVLRKSAAGARAIAHLLMGEIGRASCRERV